MSKFSKIETREEKRKGFLSINLPLELSNNIREAVSEKVKEKYPDDQYTQEAKTLWSTLFTNSLKELDFEDYIQTDKEGNEFLNVQLSKGSVKNSFNEYDVRDLEMFLKGSLFAKNIEITFEVTDDGIIPINYIRGGLN